MVQKLTTAEFIERAKNVHGDKYDYSKVVYVKNNTNVIIVCPEHGEFKKTPSNHVKKTNPQGCPECALLSRAKKRTKTTDWFLKKAYQVHGDRYDYSKSEYTGKEKEVTIICPEHGAFNQKSNVHLMGSGCPKCGLLTIRKKKRLSQDEFNNRATNIHIDKYDYSLIDYQGINKKVKIICPEHGVFEQIPSDHINNGSGCPACVGLERYGTDEFIRRANIAHDNKYDYSKVNYVNAKKKVSIICPKHGEYHQDAWHHLSGIGCPKCKADLIRDLFVKTTEGFILDARKVHGDKYDYSKVEYIDGNKDIEIICPDHGSYTQLPRTHLQNSGCPSCATSGININESGILYYLRVETRNQLYWKIGITNRTIEERFKSDMDKITVLKTWSYEKMKDGLAREKEILKQYSKYRNCRNGDKPLSHEGNTELFTRDVLGLDNYS